MAETALSKQQRNKLDAESLKASIEARLAKYQMQASYFPKARSLVIRIQQNKDLVILAYLFGIIDRREFPAYHAPRLEELEGRPVPTVQTPAKPSQALIRMVPAIPREQRQLEECKEGEA
jgi:hypothetical protein